MFTFRQCRMVRMARPRHLIKEIEAAPIGQRRTLMKTHEFAIIASGLDPMAEDFEDTFFEAGCSDATLSFQKGAIILEFARDAETFSSAVISAFSDVMGAGAKVERFEPDPLVNLSDIAARTGLSRAALSLYASGARAAHFPPPTARVTSDSPLWDWCLVSEWMYAHHKVDQEVVIRARLMKEANRIIETGNIEPNHFAQQMRSSVVALESA